MQNICLNLQTLILYDINASFICLYKPICYQSIWFSSLLFFSPAAVFLLMENQEKKRKIHFMSFSNFIIILRKHTQHFNLTSMNNTLHQSVMLIIMIELMIVLTIFISQIEIN
jgi:hypothetical protein